MKTDLIKNMKDVDLALINLLQEDCRLSYRKIARKLGIAVGTAFYHIKNLEKKGILKGYTAIVDYVKLGYSLMALILIQADGGYLTQIENEIANIVDTVAVYDITGDYNAFVIARFKDKTSLNAYVKSLISLPHVKRAVTNIALNVIKEDLRVKL